MYEEMMSSYDIQGAGHIDTLKLVCKTSLKANQLIDMGDVEGFQKMSKVYDSLMKSGKFTAAQNKAENGEFVDSVGELIELCEKQGYIERFYIDSPNDKVDLTIQDMQRYTRTLIEEETNLSNMVELALKQIQKEEEFIEKARKVHGDKYDYSKVDYKDALTKVTIICPKHGEFYQIPDNHLGGNGCPSCSGNKKLTTEEFIGKAREVHGDKYDYSKVDYVNYNTEVCIICPEHGEFYQTPDIHLRGISCPACRENRPKLDNTQSSHRVYIFDFPNKVRYVGLTMKSIEVRENEHRHGRVRSNGTYTSSVYKYSMEFNVPIPKPFIFKDDLTPKEAQYWEGWVIEDSRQNGYTLLNIAKAGGLGGYTY